MGGGKTISAIHSDFSNDEGSVVSKKSVGESEEMEVESEFEAAIDEGKVVTGPCHSPKRPDAASGMKFMDASNNMRGDATANLHGNVAEAVESQKGGEENCEPLKDAQEEKNGASFFLRSVWVKLGRLGVLKANFSFKASVAVFVVAALYGLSLSCPCMSDGGEMQDMHPGCLPVGFFFEVGHVSLSFGKLVIEELRHYRHLMDQLPSSRRMNAWPSFGKTLQSLKDAQERAEGNVNMAVETAAAADHAELTLRDSLAAFSVGKLSPHFQQQMNKLVVRTEDIAMQYRGHVKELQASFLAERSIFDFLSNRIPVLFKALLRGDKPAIKIIIRGVVDQINGFHAKIKELRLKHGVLKELVLSLRGDFHEFDHELLKNRENAEHEASINKIWTSMYWFAGSKDSWAQRETESGEDATAVSGASDSLEAVLAELHKRSFLYSAILNDIVEARNATNDATMEAMPGYGDAYSEVVVEDLLLGFRKLAESLTLNS